ncbi:unnamed protein product [Adineta steineri]|uniref:L-Fucosyltransferase n=1 Tax=Adineta steineri TaxID=433720 RepID=A0A815Q1J0_9BILA|nr:unnamed protein product [Adineta steineri]
MKCPSLSQCNIDIRRYLQQSRITVTKFIAIFFCILTALFIVYYFLFDQTDPQSTVVYINNYNNNISSSSQLTLPPDYSFLNNIKDKFKPDYVIRTSDKSQKPTCIIIIRTADGAIGNRMFLFASAYGLARLHQCDLYIAPWILTDLRSVFTINLQDTPIHLITKDSILKQPGLYGRYSSCTLFDDLLKVPLKSNLTFYEMIGFYQAFGYFIKYKDEITYLFQFNQGSIINNVPLVEQLLKAVWNIPLNLGIYTKDNVTHKYLKLLLTQPPSPLIPVTWIAIHIRRGDFLTFFKIDTSVEYLNYAMNYYRRKYINCRFLIASDDKDYAQKNLANNSDIFITPKSFFSGDDLAALALCEHTIVTAGSYGWWAAWLAGGNVLHDLTYPVPSQNCIREHYFPPWFVFPHNKPNITQKFNSSNSSQS